MVQNRIRLNEFDIERDTDGSGNEILTFTNRNTGATFTIDKDANIPSGVFAGTSVDVDDVSATDVSTTTASVTNAPTSATDVVRKNEIDGDITPSSVDTNDYKAYGNAVQASVNGYITCFGDSLGVIDVIDPTSTTTPIQDAIDLVSTQTYQGTVLLPYGEVTEEATINPKDGVNVIGRGLGGTKEGNSIIKFTDGLTELFDFNGGGRNTYFDGFLVEGNGMSGTTSLDVFHYSQGHARTNFGEIAVKSLSGTVMSGDSAGPYASHLGDWYIQGVDAGNEAALFDVRDFGPQTRLGIVDAYPKDLGSGSPSNIVQTGGCDILIQHLNVGGTVDKMINDAGGSGTKILQSYNFEPAWNSDGYDTMLLRTNWVIGIGGLNGATFNATGSSATGSDFFCTLKDAENVYVHKPELRNGYSLSSNYFVIPTAPKKKCYVYADSSEINDTTGGSTGYIRALGNAGTGVA